MWSVKSGVGGQGSGFSLSLSVCGIREGVVFLFCFSSLLGLKFFHLWNRDVVLQVTFSPKVLSLPPFFKLLCTALIVKSFSLGAGWSL